MKKFVIGLVAIGVIVAGITVLSAKNATAPTGHMVAPKESTKQGTAPQAGGAVSIQGYAFAPKNLTVKKGTKVTWTNQDVAKHNVAVDDGSPTGGPDGPLFGKGETFSFTFETVGTYNYHCSPHPYMHGSVTVTE